MEDTRNTKSGHDVRFIHSSKNSSSSIRWSCFVCPGRGQRIELHQIPLFILLTGSRDFKHYHKRFHESFYLQYLLLLLCLLMFRCRGCMLLLQPVHCPYHSTLTSFSVVILTLLWVTSRFKWPHFFFFHSCTIHVRNIRWKSKFTYLFHWELTFYFLSYSCLDSFQITRAVPQVSYTT